MSCIAGLDLRLPRTTDHRHSSRLLVPLEREEGEDRRRAASENDNCFFRASRYYNLLHECHSFVSEVAENNASIHKCIFICIVYYIIYTIMNMWFSRWLPARTSFVRCCCRGRVHHRHGMINNMRWQACRTGLHDIVIVSHEAAAMRWPERQLITYSRVIKS